MTTPPSPLTVAAAAELLCVSERTVWRYLKSGRLSGETVGPVGERRTLIPRADAEALLAERGRDPEAAALRAERDRLAAALAAAEDERRALESRLSVLQRALARPPRSRLVAWAATRVLRPRAGARAALGR